MWRMIVELEDREKIILHTSSTRIQVMSVPVRNKHIPFDTGSIDLIVCEQACFVDAVGAGWNSNLNRFFSGQRTETA